MYNNNMMNTGHLGYSQLNYKVDPEYSKRDNRAWSSGYVLAIHEIGPYRIAEFVYDNSNLGNPNRDSIQEHGTIHFYATECHHICHTLESAIATEMAKRIDGCNSDAGQFFERMLNLTEENGTTSTQPIPDSLLPAIEAGRRAIKEKVEAWESRRSKK